MFVFLWKQITNIMTINKVTYQKLKSEYDVAVKNKIEIFTFEGEELLTAYAKYLLQWLKPKFEIV
jgi:hypothetical protein